MNLYHYRATVLSVYDGDTMTLNVDLGWRMRVERKIRLYGINTPEIRGPERPDGLQVRDFVRGLVPDGTEVMLESIRDKSGKYGRWLGIIHLADGRCLNDLLIEMGYEHDY